MGEGPLQFGFESEHIFGTEIFKGAVARLLARADINIRVDMVGNRMALYSHPDTVAELRNASDSVKASYEKAGWGWNRHFGAGPGGNQTGKNAFLANELLNIDRRGSLSASDQGLR